MPWFPQRVSRRRRYDELSCAIREHLEERIEELAEAGMSKKEAEQAARREFGNVTLMEERSREVWQWPTLESIWADTRYALRRLCKSPGFAVTVVLTLAIGIGANIAIFQLIHGVLFARLPVTKPGELYSLRSVKSPFDGQWIYSYSAFEHLRQATTDSAPVIARSGFGGGVLRTNDDFSEETRFQLVSDNFFDVLGLAPHSGRFFVASDELPGQLETPVVLRYGFAKEKFAGHSSIIGMKAFLNRVPIVVVGIAPEHFSGVVQGAAPDLWLPLSAQSSGRFSTWFDSLGPGYGIHLEEPYRNQDGIFWLWLLARVPDQAKTFTKTQWTAAFQPDLRMIAGATRDANERARILAARTQLIPVPGGEGSMSAEYKQPLLLLMGMAGLVFIVGCLNLANLQLARLVTRQREIALRLSLGASPWRILRQLLVEDILLLALGGIAAFATCGILSSVLLRWISARAHLLPIDLHFGLQPFLLGSALLAAALVGFSLLPAWRITRSSLGVVIQSSVGNIAAQGHHGRKLSSLLLAGQVSLSLLLLSMAILFTQTLLNFNKLDAGLDREHLLSVHLDLVSGGLEKQDMTDTNQRVLERLRSLPSVRAAAMQMCRVPGCVWNTALHVFGRPELSEAQMHGEENHVSVGYFRTLGIPLLRGRVFDKGDRRGSQPVVVLNHSFARRLFGNEDPVGHLLGYKAAPDDRTYRVVGEVGDAQVDGLRRPAPAVAYFSLEQGAKAAATIEVRTSGAPSSVAAEIRQGLLSVNPNLPIAEIVPLNTEFEDGLSSEKLLARLTGIFAALTLALAAIGFYGLLSFHVARRTAEIGMRMALGSTRAQVQILFLRQTLTILALGILPGVLLSAVAGHFVRTLLYGVHETAPWALLLSIGVLLAVGILATLMPAQRAAALDPVKALRAE